MTHVVVEADGGSRGNPGPAGFGAVVRDAATGEVLREVAAGIGVASNNVAEDRGLIAGREAALDSGADEVDVRMDSLLVVNHMSNKWKVKHEAMRPLASQAAGLVRRFRRVDFTHVPREHNKHADRLANEAMDDAAAGREWARRTEVPQPEPRQSAQRTSKNYGWTAPTGTATTMWLLRHGETPLSVEKRFSGRGDPALTDRGVAQAKAAAHRLAEHTIAAVISSPLRRAMQTAQAVADALGVKVVVEDGFVETDFGAWEGLTFAEVRSRWPDQMSAWLASPDVAPTDGEPFSETFERVRRARESVVAGYAGSTVVIVSHVTPIKVLVREALEAPSQVLYRLHLDTASLSLVDWWNDGPAVVRLFNDTSHLGNDLLTHGR